MGEWVVGAPGFRVALPCRRLYAGLGRVYVLRPADPPSSLGEGCNRSSRRGWLTALKRGHAS